MNNNTSTEQLQNELNAAHETIRSLSKRMRQLDNNDTQSPLQKQLLSYRQRIDEKSEELSTIQHWFELIVQNAMDAIIRLDQAGRIQSWNPAAEKMFGYQKGEALGVLVKDILIPHRLRKKNIKPFEYHLKHGKGPLMNKRLEGIVLCKDNSELPVEFVGSVVKQGNELAYIASFQDISKRKKAERSLRRSHHKLELLVKERTQEVHDLATIIEANINFVSITDIQGNVQYINPAGCKMLGIMENIAFNSLSFKTICTPETYSKIMKNIIPLVLKQGFAESECEFMTQHNDCILTSCIFMTLPSEPGKPERLALIARDLRKEKALQQQVEHVDRLESLGVLAGGIAHDFNNILTSILGNAGIAADMLNTFSPAQKHLQRIEKSSLQAANLCKQMLAYSGKSSFIIQSICLTRLVKEIYPLLEVSMNKNITVTFDLDEHLPVIDADITQMQQILMNLVINATEAIEDDQHGTVHISTGMIHVDETYLKTTLHKQGIATGDFVYLKVSDSGCGMDKSTQKKIFDPFFTTKFTGRGLGMSAVLGIINGHRGTLQLNSKQGQGSTFEIAFPVPTIKKSLPKTQEHKNTNNHASGLVLVVDDEENVRETACMILKSMGVSTLTAVNGKDGIEVFKKNQHELTGVILDMTMPVMGGHECLNILKSIDSSIPIILSSGYSEEDVTKHFDDNQLEGFIQKPYQINPFQKVVSDHLCKK